MTPEKLWTGANKSMLGTDALNPGAESWHVPAGLGRWHTGSTGVQLLEAAALVSNSVFDTRRLINAFYMFTHHLFVIIYIISSR